MCLYVKTGAYLLTGKGEYICEFYIIVKQPEAEFLAYAGHNNIVSAVNNGIGISRNT